MLNRIQFAVNYLLYFFTSGTRHSVHSPFVYDFVCKVLNARKNKPMYHEFELLRSRMLKSKSQIVVQPLGASPEKEAVKVPLSTVARRSAKSARYAELLERICDYFQPQIAVEIGTSLGLSALYQASALQDGMLYTLEGNPDSAKVAAFNFEKLGFNNIQLIEGNFDEQLPLLIQALPRLDYVFFDGNHSSEATLRYFELCLQKAHNGSVFVFDDIRWSDDMHFAWSKIKNHPLVTVTVDVYAMGIVFFRKEQEKEDFVIRF